MILLLTKIYAKKIMPLNIQSPTFIYIITWLYPSAPYNCKREAFSQFKMIARNINTDRKSTRLNSSHVSISYAVFCLKKEIKDDILKAKKHATKSHYN